MSLQTALQRWSITCESFTSPLEALARYKKQPHVFDVAIVDSNMPEMPGLHLIETLWSVRPELSVILCSADLPTQWQDGPQVIHLTKPFEVIELRQCLEQALDLAPASKAPPQRSLEQKQPEVVLREDQYWKLLAKSAPGFLVLVGRDLRIRWVNRTPPSLTQEQVVGSLATDFAPPVERQITRNAIEYVFATGHPRNYESSAPALAGSAQLDIHVSTVPDNEDLVLVSTSDIGLRRRAEKAEHEHALLWERLRLSMATRDVGRWVMQLDDGKIGGGSWDDEFCGLLGLKKNTPAKFDVFVSALHQDDQVRVQGLFETIQREPVADTEVRVVGESGWLHDLQLSLTRKTEADVQTVEVVCREVAGVKDLNAEREELAAKALHGQKMESLGILASGVAHDFNNILSPVLTYAHLLQQDDLSSEERKTMLGEITAATKRVGNLAQQILSFARPADAHYCSFDAAPVVSEVVALLRASLPSSVVIEILGQAEGLNIFGDATQLHQLLLNLGINAGHAMHRQDGFLSISANAAEVEGGQAAALGLSDGRYVHFRVQDSGCGIKAVDFERIFEPFFTTRPGAGSGMGLASAHGIVRRHAGAITVESELGQGTLFQVWLPCTKLSPVEKVAQPTRLTPARPGRVLVVDDDEMILVATERLLKKHQLVAETVPNCMAALSVFQQAPESFDAVLTDYGLPDMNGLELAQGLREIRPDVPIIMRTGLATSALLAQFESFGIKHLLLKPELPEDVMAALFAVLPSGPASSSLKVTT